MTRKIKFIFLLLITFSFVSGGSIFAKNFSCNNRYVTLINPIRGRNLWIDKSITPLQNQYQEINKYDFSASWLLQYDALTDDELINFINDNFGDNQELGIFLEISPDLAKAGRVIYPHGVAWYDPQAVFLSGYSPQDRERMIEALFVKFKERFGYFPKSVGAWWIDSYSLEYIKNKYDIKTVLIVADQKTTDDYGVWGQWWGVPYFPSIANILVPARENQNQDIVVLQWAQRDLTKAHEEGPVFSNYSLQANDYTERGLDISYFENLISNYLDCNLQIGQITVGLETGIESVKSFPQYTKQLEVLNGIGGLRAVTMGEFANKFREIHPNNPQEITIKDDSSEWILSLQKRENDVLQDNISYESNIAFSDYFLADNNNFLNRILPMNQSGSSCHTFTLIIPLAFFLGLLIFKYFNFTKYYPSAALFIIASFLTTFLAYSKFGWCVFFGPVIKNIALIQFILILLSFWLILFLIKILHKKKIAVFTFLLCLTLSFGADFVLSKIRYIQLNEERYFGFGWDALRFIGIKISSNSLDFVNRDFSFVEADSFLRFNFNLIWENKIIAFIIYPVVHIILGGLVYFIIRKFPKTCSRLILFLLSVLLMFYFYWILNLDPRTIT